MVEVALRALDNQRVDKDSLQSDGQVVQHRIHAAGKDLHSELVSLTDGHPLVLYASALDSVYDDYRKITFI